MDEPNRWRLESPGSAGWARSVQPGAERKYLMISSDTHMVEPANLLAQRVEAKFASRLPRVEVDSQGRKWHLVEGMEPARWVLDSGLEGEDAERGAAPTEPAARLRDQERDGVDAEVIYPNKFLVVFATRDPEFAFAQARAYNDWAWELFGPYNDRMSPMAMVPTLDVGLAVAEVERVARLGFRGVTLPVQPIYGGGSARDMAYNWPDFDPLWAALQDASMPATFHVGTGKDPRTTRGAGGAVTNYVAHALAPSVGVVAVLCSAGILERFPRLRVASIESGVGWFPWAGQAMDEAYRKHHMWSFPKLKELPSYYLRTQCHGSFMEDRVGTSLAEEFGYERCFLWSNDYPHHEGSWPHSAEAIERQMGHLTETTRTRILGENARELFGFPRRGI